LAGISQQSRCVCERPYGNWPIVGGHAAKIVTRDENSLRPQISRAECGRHPGGTTTNDHDINHLSPASIH
jgi:hypothetical protein